ncbi:Ubiquinol-cytochrome C chaperone [hydrothermal vent metagenome]|uniref:Ubiquinol-cytochrome C chaperone n=1 Tax=hydrothermal vent metagenome TaxID=652676 RepID=A0A3B0UE41_9ZZZZ
MIMSLFRKKADTAQVRALYGAIVAQSRQPLFYAQWEVPDTVTGRFDMISLHLCLVFRRLKSREETSKIFSQALFDMFFVDMDRSLREMGAGDMAVPKRIKEMGELFYGMLGSIDAALANNDHDAICATLSRNVFDANEPNSLDRFAFYVIAQADNLNRTEIDDILAGKIDLDLDFDAIAPVDTPQ